MRTRELGSAIVGSALVACSRTDLDLSPSITSDAGTTADGSATPLMGATTQPSATTEASAKMNDEAGAAACYVGQWATALSTTYCGVAVPPMNNGCGPSEYQVGCGPAVGFTPPVADTCFAKSNNGWGGGRAFCCLCQSADAGAVCVDIDVTTYDRSCTKDSDCTVVQSGMMCPGGCDCPNAAINVDGQTRYEQTVAPLRSFPGVSCNCPNIPAPVCTRGVCQF